jgi:hypothetical protein
MKIILEGVMKRLFLPYLFLFVGLSYSQTLLLEENFDYPAGDTLTDHGWVAHSGAGIQPITVNNGGLTYTGYPSEGVGNAALLDNNGEDVYRSFSTQTSGTIYFSFLVNVINIAGGYFIHLAVNTTTFAARVFIQNASGYLQFGLSNTSTGNFGTTNFNTNTTYLCIVKYDVSATGACSLWVFSSGVPSSEIAAGAPEVTATGTGQATISRIALRQYSASENLIVDGIRIADSWSLAPLPVELSSFSAVVLDNVVKLNWQTETEVNNFGFEIERTSPFPSPYQGEGGEAGRGWETIGFVQGNGNSNSPKNYFFIDDNISGGKAVYRLKQIDTDGKFEYSKVIEIDVGSPAKFELGQNYPNPFNPVTTIKYLLPQSGNVKLVVYNLIGEQVVKLADEFEGAGVHTINFNASGLNSGVYIYKLEATGLVQSKKMILLK